MGHKRVEYSGRAREEKEKRGKAKEEARACWEEKIGRVQAELDSRAGIDREAAHIREAMEETLGEYSKR